MKKRIASVTIKKQVDEYPDTSFLGTYTDKPQKGDCFRHNAGRDEYKYFRPANPEYRWEDFKRMEGLNNGDWCYLGITVYAEIQVKINKDNWLADSIGSGGLWGIESDSKQSFFEEVAKYEMATLRIALKELGFSNKAIDRAFENAEWSEV